MKKKDNPGILKTVEQNLEDERRKLLNILDSIQDGVYILSSDRRIEYTNSVIREEFGQVNNRKCYQYFHNRKDVCPWCKFSQVIQEKTVRWEWKSLRTGKIYDVIDAPIKNPDGTISKLKVLRDVTDYKKAEEILKRDKETFGKMVEERTKELLAVQVELERAKRLSAMGILAATVAHELRNPLSVMQVALYNMKRKDKNESLDSHILNIEKKIAESERIIENLLSYSRITPPRYRQTSVWDILTESTTSVQAQFPKRKVSVMKKLDSVKEAVIDADSGQIQEVFTNLLVNAYQAVGEKKGEIKISVDIEKDTWVAVSICDNGCGIPREDIEKIFMPFFTKKEKGTGLGLSICKELVELHHGKIEVHSEENKGTKVTVILPVKQNYD